MGYPQVIGQPPTPTPAPAGTHTRNPRAAHHTCMLRYTGATVWLRLPYREASRKLAYGMAMVWLSYHIYCISMAPYSHVYSMMALGSYLIIQMDSLLI